jgi:hypothetical protein
VLFLYLKVCPSGLRGKKLEGKHMNGKIGMRAFSTLLAVMLMSVMLVPVMAVEEVWQSQGTEQNVQYDLEKYTVRLVDSEIPRELRQDSSSNEFL